MKKCQFCAEEIQDEAIKCKHCGSEQPHSDGFDDVRALARTDRIRAIQLYIQRTGSGIKVARDFVDPYTTGPAPKLISRSGAIGFVLGAGTVFVVMTTSWSSLDGPSTPSTTPAAVPMANTATNTVTNAAERPVPAPALSRNDIVEARKLYRVAVLSFDASQEFGSSPPYADFVRLRVTNGSKYMLPVITLLTKRFDAAGRLVGSSRMPALPVRDLKPGETTEVDYYPVGHLSLSDVRVAKMGVEVEALIPPDAEHFFRELTASARP